jgi:hypothetical protein
MGGDLMDAVNLKLARNYTNEKLNSLPSNAPTKTVTFDGGIYSVGNDVVNGQVSDVVIKGRTLKNELNYNRETWAEWTKSAGVVGDATGLEWTLSDTLTQAFIPFNTVKPLTKYGILANVVTNTATSVNLTTDIDLTGSNHTIITPGTLGNIKLSITTQANITFKRFTIKRDANGDVGKKVKLKDIRLFELPAGSEIETDFTMMTVDALAQKYPYIKGDSTKSTNSVRVKSVGRNLLNPDKISTSGTAVCNKVDSNSYSISVSFPNYLSLPFSNLKPNTQYTLSFNVSEISGDGLLYVYYNGTSSLKSINTNGYKSVTITTDAQGKNNVSFRTNSENFRNCLISDLQIEEGNTATEYEPYKESIVNVNLPEPLRSLPNGVKDEINVTTGKAIIRIGHKTDVASGTVINYVDMADGGQYYAWNNDGETETGIKGDTLEIDATSLTYQLATPIVTKLPAQAPLQVFENGTVYVEPIGDASESTLPSVEMTIPTGTSNKFGVATHDYGGAAADWVLTNSESKCFLLAVSSAGGAANIIAPDAPGVMYAISNASGHTITIKISGGAGGAGVADSKTVLVIHNGTDYTALTAEL